MKKAMLTTTILLGTLLSGAQVAAAAPPFAGPTDIATPTFTSEPEPEPCEVKHVTCDITLPTRTALPTDIANPTVTVEPTIPTGPSDIANPTGTPDPTEPPETTEPPVTTTTQQQPPVQQPQDPPSVVPTPNRIDTGAGPSDAVNWWLVAVPMLVLLGLAAAGTLLVIRRTERGPS